MADVRFLLPVVILAVALAAGCGAEDEPVLGPLGVAQAGDRCEPEGGYACENARIGGRRELICTDGVFEVHSSCPGGCVVAPGDGGSAYITCSGAPVAPPETVVLPGDDGGS